MADFLLELGCEEMPAGSVMPMAEHLGKGLATALQESGLCLEAPQIFATPRRIAARFPDVGSQQDDVEVERRGPAKSAAFKDGEPTKALQGFLRSAGASLDDVETVATPKGEWMVVRQKQQGKTLTDVLASALPGIVKTMPMPRRMRWGSGADEFIRPVVWLMAIHGNAVVPVTMLGIEAANKTYGHRFHAPEVIEISDPATYESLLQQACVLADPAQRRAQIVSMVQELSAQAGATPVMDEELVDEVNALVEWPVALAGKFDEQFLEIPKEALIQTMQENQRYFAQLDNNGDLLPAFITIANIESTNRQIVIDGNERVIRPRFADTMFFWNQDKQHSLESHKPELSRLLFQEKLGSVADKVSRMSELAQWLCSSLDVEVAATVRAVSLCKCDLNTEIVKELAKMQGICGRYYALRDGEAAKVAGGALPASDVSQVVSLADKTDTLVGIFGLGMKPSGTKDPFALRRASIGIVRMIIEQGNDLDLESLIDESIKTYAGRLQDVDKTPIVDYVLERLRGYLIEQEYAADAVDAVLAKSITRPLDIAARLQAIQEFRQTDAALALAAASKRIGNILKKVESTVPTTISQELLNEEAERSLYDQIVEQGAAIEQSMQSRDYAQAMQKTARLRESVDRFFDEVMVMDENLQLRNNRLALLHKVNTLCCGTAEIGLLRTADKPQAESKAS